MMEDVDRWFSEKRMQKHLKAEEQCAALCGEPSKEAAVATAVSCSMPSKGGT